MLLDNDGNAVAWADPEDVKIYTGETATEAECIRAHLLIEIFAGTTVEATNVGNISSRNQRMLTAATAYQAAWMLDHPDVFSHIDVEGVSQDGVTAQHLHANARILAPMAHRCLNRLTWKLAPWRATPSRASVPDRGTRDSAAADDAEYWTPIGSS